MAILLGSAEPGYGGPQNRDGDTVRAEYIPATGTAIAIRAASR